jgi:hypothetical protein
VHFDQTVPERLIRIPPSDLPNSTWLPAALLATLVLLASALQAFGDEATQLQWRPARTAAKKPMAMTRRPVQRTTIRQGQPRHYDIVQVAYNEQGGWSSTADSPTAIEGEARLETLVVHPRDPQFEGTGPAYRVAQDPFANDELDAELDRDINQPFGTNPVPDQLREFGLDELPEPVEPQLPNDTTEDLEDLLDDQDLPFDDEPLDDQGLFDDDDSQLRPGVEPRDPGRVIPLPGRERPRSDTSTSRGPRDMEKFEQERQRAVESCESELERARADRITSIDLGIRVEGREGWDFPFECSIDDGRPYAGRHWPEVTYMWKAAANCHKPLYFEQHHLERYGHSWGPCLQPLVSGAHFFTRLPVLPYCMGITPPNECIYPLGYYRPGSCAPYTIDPIPFTWRAALFQAGATVGTAAILP